MAQRDKDLRNMAANPQGDWTISDVERVAAAWGFTSRRGSGSHVTIAHERLPDVLTIPARRPIKAIYIRKLVDLIGRVQRSLDEDD